MFNCISCVCVLVCFCFAILHSTTVIARASSSSYLFEIIHKRADRMSSRICDIKFFSSIQRALLPLQFLFIIYIYIYRGREIYLHELIYFLIFFCSQNKCINVLIFFLNACISSIYILKYTRIKMKSKYPHLKILPPKFQLSWTIFLSLI